MIYEEKQTGIGPALLLLCGVFLFSFSPWLLSLRDLFWQEGVYAGISSELSGIPPLLTLHGEYVNGVFPFYPVLVNFLHSSGCGMEFSLRIIPVLSLAILVVLVYFCCWQAAGKQAGAAGAAAMLSSIVVFDKGLEGNPAMTISLGIFTVWLVWYDLGAWQGSWNLAWSTSGFLGGLLFYAGGWQALTLAVLPMLFLRRPLMLRNKPRGPGFVFCLGFIFLFILAWGMPRWFAGMEGAFSPDFFFGKSGWKYLKHLLLFPFEAAMYLMPWTLFAWAPFCPAVIMLDRNPLLCKYFRTLVTVLFVLLWISPATQSRDLLCLVPPLSVLIGLNYWIAVRRFGDHYLFFLRWSAIILFLLGAAGMIYLFMPNEILVNSGWFQRDLSYRESNYIFYFGFICCSVSMILSILTFLASNHRGSRIWQYLLIVFSAGTFLFQAVVLPYKAASHENRDLGLELKQLIGNHSSALTVYKYSSMPHIYIAGHYMGCRIITVENEKSLPQDDRVIYVFSPDVPSLPNRTWKCLFNRPYKKNQNLLLWRGELKDYEAK